MFYCYQYMPWLLITYLFFTLLLVPCPFPVALPFNSSPFSLCETLAPPISVYIQHPIFVDEPSLFFIRFIDTKASGDLHWVGLFVLCSIVLEFLPQLFGWNIQPTFGFILYFIGHQEIIINLRGWRLAIFCFIFGSKASIIVGGDFWKVYQDNLIISLELTWAFGSWWGRIVWCRVPWGFLLWSIVFLCGVLGGIFLRGHLKRVKGMKVWSNELNKSMQGRYWWEQ